MEIKKILLGGCSFVNGYDIFYEKYNIQPYTDSGDVWFKILTDAQKSEIKNTMTLGGKLKNAFNSELEDMSVPGWSNDNIAKKMIDYIYNNMTSIDTATTLVVIGWTENSRVTFINQGQALNTNAFHINHYINYNNSVKNNLPDQYRTPNRVKIYDSKIEFYNKLIGWSEIWKNDDMSIIAYSHHMSLILLLQWFLEKHNIKYCFFNSLDMRLTYKDTHGDIYPTDYLVDWQNWYPWNDKNSYSNFSWYDLIKNEPTNFTKTSHPSVNGLELFSTPLIDFIKKNYS
jgi:hypothetical protein